MASIKTSTSVSVSAGTSSAKKPSAGPAAGASAGMVSSTPPAPKPPKAPTAPKTPIAKADEELAKGPPLDYSQINKIKQKPQGPSLDYAKINKPTTKPATQSLDYAKINAKSDEAPEPKSIDYSNMSEPSPPSAVALRDATKGKIEADSKATALDALKAKRMFRKRYLKEAGGGNMAKNDPSPTTTAPSGQSSNGPYPPGVSADMSSKGTQDNVAKMKAGQANQPGALATLSGLFKGEELTKFMPPTDEKSKMDAALRIQNNKKDAKAAKPKLKLVKSFKEYAAMRKSDPVAKGDVINLKDKSVVSDDTTPAPKRKVNSQPKQAMSVGNPAHMRDKMVANNKGPSKVKNKVAGISKSEREFIKEDLMRPYTPYFNDVDDLVKKEFKPLEAEIILDVAIRLEKGEIKAGELAKADPLDKYKIDKGGSLKFGTHVKDVGFPRNTLDSEKNAKAGSDEGSGGQIKKAGLIPTKPAATPKMPAPHNAKAPAPKAPAMPKMNMTKAEIEAECKEDFKPKFRK